MGFMFLVYFIELLNIPINLENIGWTQLSEEDLKNTPTFLSELINFLFWKSNFGTFHPILIAFIAQIKFKIIPILIILIMLYIPLMPSNRWYNSVWEFYFDNRDYIRTVFMSEWEQKDAIEKKFKYAWLWDSEKNDSLIYKDNSFLLTEINKDTLDNSLLNSVISQQMNLYENVYDDKSFNAEKKRLDENIIMIENKIKDLTTKKDLATQKSDITNYINSINQAKDELWNLKNTRKDIDKVYSTLQYKIDLNNLKPYEAEMKVNLSYNDIQLNIVNDKLNIEQSKTNKNIVEKDYEEIIMHIDQLLKWTDIKNIKWSNEYVDSNIKNIDDYINGIKLTDIQKTAKLNELRWLYQNAKNNILSTTSVSNLMQNQLELKKTASELNDKLININWIETNPNARLDYIINENAKALSELAPWVNDTRRQSLLLLQYKLLQKKENTWWNNNTMTVKLLWNKVEYVWANLIHWYDLVIKIITYVFNFIWYSSLILFAWWKNLLILYISILNFIMSRMEKFIWGTKTANNINQHINAVISNIFPRWEDKELTWYQENQWKKETYIIIVSEFMIRFWIIYWLINL